MSGYPNEAIDPANRVSRRWLGWVRGDISLGDEECDEFVARCLACESQAAKVGAAELSARRQSYIRRVDPSPETRRLHERIRSLAEAINDTHFGFDVDGIISADFLEYHGGFGRFDWHVDYGYVNDRVRKLTIIIQLSRPEDYVGGELEVFDAGAIALPQERGAVLSFPSFVPHHVTPVTGGLRRSLVAWLTGPAFR